MKFLKYYNPKELSNLYIKQKQAQIKYLPNPMQTMKNK